MKQEITIFKNYLIRSWILLVMVLSFGSATSQEITLLGWNANGVTGFGVSPWTPATQNTNVLTSRLIRGSSIGIGGAGAAGCWGGAGNGSWNPNNGMTSDNNSFHFTITAKEGYKMSLNSISTATRRSNTGPSGYKLYYSVDGAPFQLAGSATTSATSGTTGTANSTSLSSIAELQNIPSGKTVKFRINPTGNTGNYYLTGSANALKVNGSIIQDLTAPVATAATDIESGSFIANWEEVQGATGYRIDVSTDENFNNILESYDDFSVSGLSLLVNLGIEPNTTYYYRVRAEKDAVTSANSNTISVITAETPNAGILDAPVATDATEVTMNNFTANWNTVGTATGYSLDVSTSPTFGSVQNGSTFIETFENIPSITTGDWNEDNHLGNSGTEWKVNNARTNQTGDTGKMIALRGPESYIESGVIQGGIASLEFIHQRKGLGAAGGPGQFKVSVLTGENFSTITDLGTFDFTSVVGNFQNNNINITEDCKIKIENLIQAPNALLALDNITFTTHPAYMPSFVTGYENLFVSGTSIEVTGLTGNTTYYYRVRAERNEEISDNSNVIEVTTICNETAVPTIVNPQFCASATVADLIALDTNADLKWYTEQTGGTAMDTDTSVVSGTYYVSNIQNGCESERIMVEVTINEVPNAPTVSVQNFCGVTTVADLIALDTNADLKWYNEQTGSTALEANTSVTSGTYYVSNTQNGCESQRTMVEITVNEIPEALTASAQEFCSGATVAELIPAPVTATPPASENFEGLVPPESSSRLLAAEETWDSGTWNFEGVVRIHAQNNGVENSNTLVMHSTFSDIVDAVISPVLNGGVHTVSFYAYTHGSPKNLKVIKIVNGIETLVETVVILPSAQSSGHVLHEIDVNDSSDNIRIKFTTDGLVDNLIYMDNFVFNVGESETINWYNVAENGAPLANTDALATGTYYVSKTVNGCESPRTEVEVTVNPAPETPTAEAQAFCGNATVADLIPALGEGALPPSDSVTESFENFSFSSSESSLTLDTGIWTLSPSQGQSTLTFPSRICSGVHACRLLTNSTVTSPVFQGIESISFYTETNGPATLVRVIKIVNGVETLLQEVNVTTVDNLSLSTIEVNETNNVQIKFETANGQSYKLDEVTFNLYTNNSTTNWYNVAEGGSPLTADTALITGTYYVSRSSGDCESARTEVIVTINELPQAPAAQAQSFCGSATIENLNVTLAEGAVKKWYATADAAEPLTNDTAIATGTYYVSQSLGDCESTRTEVTVTINELPQAPVAQAQSFCGDATVADLEVTITEGAVNNWYSTADATEALTSSTVLTSQSYYVSQTINGCESPKTEVAVTINQGITAPTAQAQTFCGVTTIADLQVTLAEGAVKKWYATADASEVLTDNTPVTTGSYYVSQSLGDCESSRIEVAVIVNSPVPTVENQELCQGATVADLQVTSIEGALVQWFAGGTFGEPLANTYVLTSGNYYVSQTIDGCESTRVPFTITIKPNTPAPTGEEVQDFTTEETLADFTVVGENIKWYDAPTGGNELQPTDLIVEGGIYYASQTIEDACGESTERLKVIAGEYFSTGDFDNNGFSYYPNPVKSILSVVNNEIISSVQVYNSLGQLVINNNPGVTNANIDMSGLAVGYYIVKVQSGTVSKTIKIIKD